MPESINKVNSRLEKPCPDAVMERSPHYFCDARTLLRLEVSDFYKYKDMWSYRSF
jgi:hypothetical protein